MRVLLHICCGPCAIMPVRKLCESGHDVAGWFHNPNVHPLVEYLRRRQGAAQVAALHDIPLFFPDPGEGQTPGKAEYDLAAWCREALGSTGGNCGGRCLYCRESRFQAAAEAARERGFEAFTSSLLYSRRQDHEGMRIAGEKAAEISGVKFLYQDFRPFWQEGITRSKELGVYRQQYCGCMFSEEERYGRDLEKAVHDRSRDSEE